MDDVGQRLAAARLPALRAHQAACLAAFDADPGSGRYHFVLPPGAGKTVLGAAVAQRAGRRTLVLVPNTAIQEQWLRLWTGAGAVTVGDDRSLASDVTVLTYQALATFDDDADPTDESMVARLHPNALEIIDALHDGEPFTVVLDEAHHLAQTWGRLLAEVLQQAHAGQQEGPVVVALTATPRESLSPAEAELVETLFGPVRYAVSTPALVRDGVLAPYRELAWFVTPTDAERDYLARSAQHWQQLIVGVMEPEFAQPGLLAYLDPAWVAHEGVSWAHIERTRPELARALLRASHQGLLALPEGARLRDEHRQPVQVDDWVEILSDYARTALAGSDAPGSAWQQLRAAMSSVGWTLTRKGARRGQSPVDRVLARSAAKATAAGYLVQQEYLVRGDDLRAIVLTDYENVGATAPVDLQQILTRHAGSAWEALRQVQASNPALRCVLMTGTSVGGDPDVLAGLLPQGLTAVPRDDGLSRVEGGWTPRAWVAHLTAAFQAGEIDVLVGTRGMWGKAGTRRPPTSWWTSRPPRLPQRSCRSAGGPSAATRSARTNSHTCGQWRRWTTGTPAGTWTTGAWSPSIAATWPRMPRAGSSPGSRTWMPAARRSPLRRRISARASTPTRSRPPGASHSPARRGPSARPTGMSRRSWCGCVLRALRLWECPSRRCAQARRGRLWGSSAVGSWPQRQRSWRRPRHC
ncbi:MAG: DEAD/DEAH box helicase family protein [Micrococcales bacterium]|nr:DEAD/DEAH box helicase family protein [Micrococcales bacterium]